MKKVKLGLGWDTRVDIDASVIMLKRNGALVDAVSYLKTKSNDSSVFHSGDNRTGDGAGDDEVIVMHLDKIYPYVESIWAVITIYSSNK